MRFQPAVLASALLLSGCIFDFHEERLAGPYSLVAVDTEDQLCVCYRTSEHSCEDRISPTVLTAGANERYIVASRRDYSTKEGRFAGEEQFFYIDRNVDGPSVAISNSVKGPFTRIEFQSLAAQLGLPSMHAVHG